MSWYWDIRGGYWLNDAEGSIASLQVCNPRGYARGDLWTPVKLRKECYCMVCDDPLHKGDEAFAPMGNYLFRMERICRPCLMKTLSKGAKP